MIAIMTVPDKTERALTQMIDAYSVIEHASIFSSEVAGGYERVSSILVTEDPNLWMEYLSIALEKFMEARPRVICHLASKASVKEVSDLGYSVVLVAPKEWSAKKGADHLISLGLSSEVALQVAEDAVDVLADTPRAMREWGDLEDLLPSLADEGGDYVRMRGIQDDILTDILTRFDEEKGLSLFDTTVGKEEESPLDEEELGKGGENAELLENESPGGLYEDDSLASEED
jgi:hypothetical protein